MIDFVSKRYYFYAFSLLLGLCAAAAIVLWGLVLGVDFKGGKLLELRFAYDAPLAEVKQTIEGLKIQDVLVRESSKNTFLVNTPDISADDYQNMKNVLLVSFGPYEELRFDSVGPTVSATIRNRAISVIGLVLVLISFYIAYAFRRASSRAVSSFRYGLATLIALFHDIFLTVGFYSVYGRFAGAFVDINFIVALLVVLGFSVHDTIVVFDRIRENLPKHKGDFVSAVNASLNQTLVRSVTTSVTVILALVAILLFGGTALHPFVSALIFGILVGTYSSIFIASALLVDWYRRRSR